MKTEDELNDEILKVTLKIKSEYPELGKHLSEMPVTIPDEKNPDVNTQKLQDYLNTLKAMLKKYREKTD